METKNQIKVYFLLLAVYAVVAFLTYTVIPLDQLTAGVTGADATIGMPGWLLGLVNAGIILVVYGALGLFGFWLMRRVGMPGIFRREAGWKGLFLLPLGIGLAAGLALILIDRIVMASSDLQAIAHPTFPLSIFASISAGIGEEILFRLFVFGLWAFLLNLVFRRWHATPVAIWIANGIAALAFSAGHLPAAMMLTGAASPAELPAVLLVEVFLLNSLLGLVAGWRMMRDGLVAAAGVHFWADILWHVLYPLVGL